MFCGYSIVAKQPPPYACERVLVVVVVCKAVHYNAMSSLPTTCNLQPWRAVTMPVVYNVSAAAAIVGCSPSTLRNWIKTFAPYLSPGASPQAGAERILTPADVATLQYIKTQRDALKDYDMIVAELTAMPPGAALQPYIDVQATATQPEAPQSPAVGIGSASVFWRKWIN